MNLTSEKYDIIMLDAFVYGESGETCAPESFQTQKFVGKAIEHLSSDGVLMVNTLPQYCSKYMIERNLLHDFFGPLFIGSFYGNRILIGQKGKKGTIKREIESRIEFYKKMFARVDTDIDWIAESFKHFKKYKRNSFYINVCDLFTYTFHLDNVCSI
jgi:hypothetical protein